MALLVLGVALLALGCILSGRHEWFLLGYVVLMLSFIGGALFSP